MIRMIVIYFAILTMMISTIRTATTTAFPVVVVRQRRQPQQLQRFVSSCCSFSSPTSTTTTIQEEEQETDHTNDESTTTSLSWERFDFSTSPKYDARFQTKSLLSIKKNSHDDDDDDNNNTSVLSKQEELDLLYQQDRILDAQFRQSLQRSQMEWTNIDPHVLQTAIDTVEPFVNIQRRNKIQTVLRQRTQNTRFVFENPVNPSNVWACLRTLDAFGIQYVHIIMDPVYYEKGKLTVTQKHGMRTAMGSAKWLTITHHESTRDAIQQLRSHGYQIYAADLGEENGGTDSDSSTGNNENDDEKKKTSRDIRNIQFGHDEKVCIVMGNEQRGISNVMRQLADHLFYLPMVGFAESFNVSVATAITLANLMAKQHRSPIQPGDLNPHEYQCLYLKGLIHSLPQKQRMAKALLHKLDLPPEITGNNW
jgi:tRNA (guanosine-2'-O-)-methyltransferase